MRLEQERGEVYELRGRRGRSGRTLQYGWDRTFPADFRGCCKKPGDIYCGGTEGSEKDTWENPDGKNAEGMQTCAETEKPSAYAGKETKKSKRERQVMIDGFNRIHSELG